MKLRPTPERGLLPDGVYLGLPEPRYFDQPLLGSSDLSLLWRKREGWWWKSRHNPHYVEEKNPARNFGSALHTRFLEGPEAFAERFAVLPSPKQYPDLIRTIPDLVSALYAAEAPGVNPRARKKDLLELAKVYLPDRHIWDVILERFGKKAGGRILLEAEEAWQIDIMLEAALADPDMNAVVTASGGVRLTELSVIWTLPSGTRMRFRFDSMLPTVNADLKTIDAYRDSDTLADAIGRRIGNDALDIQAALSFVARKAAYIAIREGRVYATDPTAYQAQEQAAWLARFPREAPLDTGDPGRPGWAWFWMFYQKADKAGRAPTIMPVRMAYGGLRHRDGYRKAVHALTFYERTVAERGLEKPWTRVEPIHHVDEGAAAPDREIRLPIWNEQPMAVAGEESELKWHNS